MSQRRPNALMIVHASAELYGSDRACLAIAKAALAQSQRVVVLVPEAGPLVAELEAAGAQVRVLDPLILRKADLRLRRLIPAVIRWPRAIRELQHLADREDFDLVHSNCAPTLGGLVLARAAGVPHVWHVHEIFTPRAVRRFFEILLNRADIVVAASSAIASQFGCGRLRRKVVVAPTGAAVPPGLSGEAPFVSESPRLLCVGRLNAWKGQEYLIRAAALMRDRGRPVRIDFVGGVYADQEHFRERLERLVEDLDLVHLVTFLGERIDVPDLMCAADAVVVPSATPEPFGMVMVEAMALGRPVIATEGGGPSEVISHGVDGLLVKPRSPRALADAIDRLMGAPALAAAMGQQARLTARRYSPDQMASIVLQAHAAARGN